MRSFAVAILAMALAASAPAYAQQTQQGTSVKQIDEVLLYVRDGAVHAPKAIHEGSGQIAQTETGEFGWKAQGVDDYYSFDAREIFPAAGGTLEIDLAVLAVGGAAGLGNMLQEIVTLFDAAGTPFFSVAINDKNVMVGSYPLHAAVMEDAFGGVVFSYLDKIGAGLGSGTSVRIKVKWGDEPSDDVVYINGTKVGVEGRMGPKSRAKPPGFEPTAALSTFFDGFTSFDARTIGPPATLAVGRKAREGESVNTKMQPPVSIAIKSVSIYNVPRPEGPPEPAYEDRPDETPPALDTHSLK